MATVIVKGCNSSQNFPTQCLCGPVRTCVLTCSVGAATNMDLLGIDTAKRHSLEPDLPVFLLPSGCTVTVTCELSGS